MRRQEGRSSASQGRDLGESAARSVWALDAWSRAVRGAFLLPRPACGAVAAEEALAGRCEGEQVMGKVGEVWVRLSLRRAGGLLRADVWLKA